MLLQLFTPLCFHFRHLSSEALMSIPGTSPQVNGTTTSLHRSERGRDSVHVLKQLKCLGSVASLEVKGEIDFLLVVPPSNSLSLLSPLPNVSFDVYCWDFKRTLSTSAGVGFSEQRAESSTFLGAKKWIPPHSHPKSRSPTAVPLPRCICRGPLLLMGLESGWCRVPSSFPSLSKGMSAFKPQSS